MTEEFYKALDGKVFRSYSEGTWKAKAEPHPDGVHLTFRPEPEQEDAGVLLLILYVDDGDEQYAEELHQSIINWIETNPKLRPPLAMFNHSEKKFEAFQKMASDG